MGKGDIETGGALYPTMCESPELRWAFIRKVYTILSVQLLLTAAVAFAVVSLPNIGLYVRHTIPGIVIYILSVIISFIRKLNFLAGLLIRLPFQLFSRIFDGSAIQFLHSPQSFKLGTCQTAEIATGAFFPFSLLCLTWVIALLRDYVKLVKGRPN